jgi:hypothetical protein
MSMHEKQDETNILSIIFSFLQKYPEEKINCRVVMTTI